MTDGVTNAYISSDELKAATSGGITQSTSDADIDRAIDAASRAIDQACNRRFWQDAAVVTRYYTFWHDPTLPTDLYLNSFSDSGSVTVDDISTSDGLILRTDPGDDGTYEITWTLGTDFRLTPINAAADHEPWTRLERIRGGANTWPGGRHNISLTARFGWAAVPRDIQQATLTLAQRYFQRRTTPFGVAGNSDQGVVRITKNDYDVQTLITPYKRVQVPGRQRVLVV